MKRRKKAVAICLIFAMCISYLPAMTMSSMAGEKQTITLNVKSKSLTVGQKYQLSVGKVSHGNIGKEVKWKSSNSKVAEVSDKGKVSAKKAGTATITAVSKTNSKIKATCKIRVYKKVKSILLKK